MVTVPFSRALAAAFGVMSVVGLVACGPSEPTKVAPAFSSEAVTAATEAAKYSYTVTVTGEPAPALTATAAPEWLSLEGNVLSGTPVRADIGSHEVTLTASNGVEPDAVQSFTVVVAASGPAPAFTSTPATAATEGQQYSYTASATGDPAPSITATTLPGWLTFEGNVLSGTPSLDHGGAHQVVLTASNGRTPDAVQTFTVTVTVVSMAPSFTSTEVTTATEGQLYSYTPVATGNPAATITATTLPGWLTFDGAVLSGTPAFADGGPHDVVLSAANGIGAAATQAFTVTVTTVSAAPELTSIPVTDALEGSAYSYTVTSTGTPAPALTATGAAGAALPAWLAFDPATGILSGTPGASDVGDHDVEIAAANGIPPDATQSFTIQVAPIPVPPAITSTPVTAAVEGDAYSYTVTATGAPAPALSATLAGGAALPAWLAFDAGTGELSGTPGASDVGSLDVEIVATNGVAPDATQTFTLIVAAALPPGIPLAGSPYLQGFGTTTPAGWAFTGDWEFGIPTTGVASVGPPSLLDGEVAATKLAGNYTLETLSSLQTPTFDFTGVAAPTLRFTHWHNFDFSGTNYYHGGNIKLSTDGGQTWIQLASGSVTPVYTGAISTSFGSPIAGEQAWSAVLTNWTAVGVDLGPTLAGKPLTHVALRFDCGTDDFGPQPGWYLDAVGVGDASALPQPAAITSGPPSPLTVVVAQPFSHTVTATGTPAPTLAATGTGGGPLPAWLTFNPGTGVLSGTPASGDLGNHPVVITASNGVPPVATQSFTLNVTPPPPPNPTCASALPLTLPATVSGSTLGSTNDYAAASSCGSATGLDVAYTFTTSTAGTLSVKVTPKSPTYRPTVSVRGLAQCVSGTSVTTAGCQTAHLVGRPVDLTISELPAGEWYVVVDGNGGTAGSFDLTVSHAPFSPQTNEACATAEPLVFNADGVAHVLGTTRGMMPDMTTSCGASSGSNPDAVYQFTAPALPAGATGWQARAELFGLNADEFHPILSVRTDCNTTSATGQISCGSSTSNPFGIGSNVFAPTPGTDYFIVVDGTGTTRTNGPFSLKVTLAADPHPQDTCASAIPLTANTSVSGSTLGAADDYNTAGNFYAPCGSSYTNAGQDVVYSYTPTTSGPATVRLWPQVGFDIVLLVMSSCAPNACIGYSDSPSPELVTFNAVAGNTYYFVVDYWQVSGTSGSGGFTIGVQQ